MSSIFYSTVFPAFYTFADTIVPFMHDQSAWYFNEWTTKERMQARECSDRWEKLKPIFHAVEGQAPSILNLKIGQIYTENGSQEDFTLWELVQRVNGIAVQLRIRVKELHENGKGNPEYRSENNKSITQCIGEFQMLDKFVVPILEESLSNAALSDVQLKYLKIDLNEVFDLFYSPAPPTQTANFGCLRAGEIIQGSQRSAFLLM